MRSVLSRRSIAAMIALVPLLSLLGSSALPAKKPPAWQWTVTIPLSGSYNLWGGEADYRDAGAEDGVWAEIDTERTKGSPPVSSFGIAIFKCQPGELCYMLSPERVNLWGIEFEAGVESPGEGPCCVFPEPCNTTPGVCLGCFVNGQHPHWGNDSQEFHDDDYRYFFFEVTVPGDFEDFEGVVQSSGELDIALFTDNDYLPTGYEDHHLVRAHVELPDDDAVTITRVGPDTWKVDVSVPRGMRFVERYRGCGKRNPQGKCVGGWVYKSPLRADTSNTLHFQAQWTRTRK